MQTDVGRAGVEPPSRDDQPSVGEGARGGGPETVEAGLELGPPREGEGSAGFGLRFGGRAWCRVWCHAGELEAGEDLDSDRDPARQGGVVLTLGSLDQRFTVVGGLEETTPRSGVVGE